MRLLLIRHGRSEHSVRRIVAGPDGCPGLTSEGREQADRLRQRLVEEDTGFDVVLSSNVLRARETAAILKPAVSPNADIVSDKGLCEMIPGEGDGLPTDEFARRYGSFDPVSEPDRQLSPGGDSWQSLQARTRETLAALAERHRGERVLAVTHAGFIVMSFLELFAVPRPGTRARVDPDFTSITEWECDDSKSTWRLVRFNDTAHLSFR